MTRAELQRLLDVAVLRRQITTAQAARVLAAYDAGTLDVDRIAATPADTAALVAVELVEQPERRRFGGAGYIYDPGTRRYVPITLPPPGRPSIEGQIADQLRYLRGFVSDILTGRQPLDGRALARARQYGQASRGVYESVRGRVAEAMGYDEEMRVLHGTDHCSASSLPGCIESAGRWAPIGTLPRIGGCTCRQNCRCHFTFRKSV